MCVSSNLDSLFAQEVGSGVQHVCGVRGVVVGVGGVVARLHQLQPGAQRGLRAVQELAHAKTGEDLQPEVRQRSAEEERNQKTLREFRIWLIVEPPRSFSSFWRP